MSIQPLELWGHWGAPNPWKVCIILEHLHLPYKIHYKELSETKTEEYLAITPNGRLPAIKDPNSGITLWETGAIILYLIDRYDTEAKISYKDFPEKYLTQQWLAFQISGQGPYFGQATWFARFHPERLPSATARYVDEIFRVTGVLDKAIQTNGTGWLVGNRVTYADLSFVTWCQVGEGLLKELGRWEGFWERFPNYVAWIAGIRDLDSVKKIEEHMARGRAANGLA